MLRCSEDPAESETSSPKAGEKKSSPSEVALRPRNQLEIIAVTHTFQGFFSNAGNPRQNPFFFFFFFFSGSGVTNPDGGTCCCKAFRRCHFHSHCHVPPELPKANSFWQPGAGSDPPPVILFLHMASSVKHSLTFLPAPPPPPPPRGTCDWLACCRHSCHGSPSVLINAVDLPKSCLPQQLARLLARPDRYDVARSAANRR